LFVYSPVFEEFPVIISEKIRVKRVKNEKGKIKK
jgi:hypothetical protein